MNSSSSSTVPRIQSVNQEDFIFKKADWEFMDTPEGRAVKGLPGTWMPTFEGAPDWLLGIISCPNCGANLLLHDRIHTVDRLGRIRGADGRGDLECNSCSFCRPCYLDEWNNKPLYSCAIEVDGEPQIHYMHASNQAEARLHLGPIAHKKSFKIVAIGRAIAVIARDDHGDNISADVLSPSTKVN
jgi:hypothetical protein